MKGHGWENIAVSKNSTYTKIKFCVTNGNLPGNSLAKNAK